MERNLDKEISRDEDLKEEYIGEEEIKEKEIKETMSIEEKIEVIKND